jgi:hypothetical protein
MMTDERKPSSNYEVGFGKPPKDTQFKIGNSGNPRGAKKGAISFEKAVEKEMNSKITILEGGKKKSVTKAVALAKAYVGKALKGDDRAFAKLIPFIQALNTAKQIENATEGLSDIEKLILKRNAKRLLEKLSDDDEGDDVDE